MEELITSRPKPPEVTNAPGTSRLQVTNIGGTPKNPTLGQLITQHFNDLNSRFVPSGDSQKSSAQQTTTTKAPEVVNAAKGLTTAAGAVAGGALAGVGSAVGGIANAVASFHRDNTAYAMQNRDYEAAHSVGLVSPAQLSAGFTTIRNGKQVQTPYTQGPSYYST